MNNYEEYARLVDYASDALARAADNGYLDKSKDEHLIRAVLLVAQGLAHVAQEIADLNATLIREKLT